MRIAISVVLMLIIVITPFFIEFETKAIISNCKEVSQEVVNDKICNLVNYETGEVLVENVKASYIATLSSDTVQEKDGSITVIFFVSQPFAWVVIVLLIITAIISVALLNYGNDTKNYYY